MRYSVYDHFTLSRISNHGAGNHAGTMNQLGSASCIYCGGGGPFTDEHVVSAGGTSALFMIQLKISGSTSQKAAIGGRTGSWCPSMFWHIASRSARMRRQTLNSWQGNRLVRAFLFEHVAKDRCRRTAVAMPIEIHNIV